MGFFEQIVFVPIKKEPSPISSASNGETKFDYWIIEQDSELLLLVKCPICFFTYTLFTVGNVEVCNEVMQKYTDFNYRRVIRECPNNASHIELEKERRLLLTPRQLYG